MNDPKPDFPSQDPTAESEHTYPTDLAHLALPNAVAPAQANSSGRIEAQAIAEICLIAGMPQRTAEFLGAGLSESQVRRELLNARAQQPEIDSRINADAGTTTPAHSSPVVAAAKKLFTKE